VVLPTNECRCDAPGMPGKTIGSSASRWLYVQSARNSGLSPTPAGTGSVLSAWYAATWACHAARSTLIQPAFGGSWAGVAFVVADAFAVAPVRPAAADVAFEGAGDAADSPAPDGEASTRASAAFAVAGRASPSPPPRSETAPIAATATTATPAEIAIRPRRPRACLPPARGASGSRIASYDTVHSLTNGQQDRRGATAGVIDFLRAT
jgi:hypothetical protein